jgi:hypothetical protein
MSGRDAANLRRRIARLPERNEGVICDSVMGLLVRHQLPNRSR